MKAIWNTSSVVTKKKENSKPRQASSQFKAKNMLQQIPHCVLTAWIWSPIIHVVGQAVCTLSTQPGLPPELDHVFHPKELHCELVIWEKNSTRILSKRQAYAYRSCCSASHKQSKELSSASSSSQQPDSSIHFFILCGLCMYAIFVTNGSYESSYQFAPSLQRSYTPEILACSCHHRLSLTNLS
jgi:hypothetical protein